jgi:hypothetical protein
MRSAWVGIAAAALFGLVAVAGCKGNPCAEVARRACDVAQKLDEAAGGKGDKAHEECRKAQEMAEKAGDTEREACAKLLKVLEEPLP